MNKTLTLCAILGAASLLAGCGTGGSSSGTTATTRAAVLLTDGPREDYAHVWATIYHVELVPQTGSPVVLFDDPAGHQIDLKTLRDASGERFSFLGSAAIPAGIYTGVNVTVAPTMQLFRSGAAVGDPLAVDSTVPKDASGNPILSLTFATPKTVLEGSTTNIVVDFDLARFVVRASGVLPAIKEGALQGIGNFARHNAGDYRGTVSGLTGTAPDLSFTLTRRDATTVTVTTSASTALFGATLADGVVVYVRGTLDTTTNTLVATQVDVKSADAAQQRMPRVFGAASSIEATAGTFAVAVTGGCNFTLGQTSVNVVTNASTVFRGDAGATQTATEFFTALAATPNVAVEGTYNATSNTLTATSARVVDTTQDGGWNRGGNGFRRGSDRSNWGNGSLRR